MPLPAGIELRIFRELDVNTLKISVYKNRMHVGFLLGYKNHKNKTVSCYPSKGLVAGTFGPRELPITRRIDELPWERKEG